MLLPFAARSLIDFKPGDERIITARFQGEHCKITIVQSYAPTNVCTEEEKDSFNDSLKAVLAEVPIRDVLLVMGDLNAKVGNENTGLEKAIGRHGCGDMNENGERLAAFCLKHELVVGGTLFQHKEIYKLT